MSLALQSEVWKMTDMIFEFCYLILFMSGFCILLGICSGLFELVYKYCPALRKWADDFIDFEDEESEA